MPSFRALEAQPAAAASVLILLDCRDVAAAHTDGRATSHSPLHAPYLLPNRDECAPRDGRQRLPLDQAPMMRACRVERSRAKWYKSLHGGPGLVPGQRSLSTWLGCARV
jgi:hypothetical protein